MVRSSRHGHGGPPAALPHHNAGQAYTDPGTRRALWVAATAMGLFLHLILLITQGGKIYPGDHDDFVRWGIQATDRGLLTLYHEPPARRDSRALNLANGQWIIQQRAVDRICNYPPLSTYLLYISGLIFKAVSPERLINTPTTQILFSGWSVLGDFLVAAGCAAIVSRFRPGRAVDWTYLLVLLAPPLWWDSVIWNQWESVVLAPAVWMLYAMIRGRWELAGVLWGVALALKPQAILFIPLWGYALLTSLTIGPVLGGLAAVAVLMVAALPYSLHSGLTWLHRSYAENLFANYSDRTTMYAFNIWYADLLASDSFSTAARWLGVTKDIWGKVFLIGGLLLGFAGSLWRWGSDRRGLVLWTAVSLLLFVMLPTQVHERYLVLVLPFLGVAVAFSRRLWPGLIMLVIVMMAQLSWPIWLSWAPGRSGAIREDMAAYQAQFTNTAVTDFPVPQPQDLDADLQDRLTYYGRQRADTEGFEWGMTVLALFGSALTLLALAGIPREQPPHDAPSHQSP